MSFHQPTLHTRKPSLMLVGTMLLLAFAFSTQTVRADDYMTDGKLNTELRVDITATDRFGAKSTTIVIQPDGKGRMTWIPKMLLGNGIAWNIKQARLEEVCQVLAKEKFFDLPKEFESNPVEPRRREYSTKREIKITFGDHSVFATIHEGQLLDDDPKIGEIRRVNRILDEVKDAAMGN